MGTRFVVNVCGAEGRLPSLLEWVLGGSRVWVVDRAINAKCAAM